MDRRRVLIALGADGRRGPVLAASFERAQHQGAHEYCAGRTQDRYRVLSLCGTTGAGDPYHSDFAVSRDGGMLRPIEPVFWLNVRFVGAGRDPRVAQALAPEALPEPCA